MVPWWNRTNLFRRIRNWVSMGRIAKKQIKKYIWDFGNVGFEADFWKINICFCRHQKVGRGTPRIALTSRRRAVLVQAALCEVFEVRILHWHLVNTKRNYAVLKKVLVNWSVLLDFGRTAKISSDFHLRKKINKFV